MAKKLPVAKKLPSSHPLARPVAKKISTVQAVQHRTRGKSGPLTNYLFNKRTKGNIRKNTASHLKTLRSLGVPIRTTVH